MNDQDRRERFITGRGFVAALDQSGGSTPGTLSNYGVAETEYSGEEEMFRHIHGMRMRIMSTPAFDAKRVLATILFQATANSEVDGTPLPVWLWDVRGVLPILKVDVGLDEVRGGMQMMLPIPDLKAVLAAASSRGVFGTKMRSVIGRYSPGGINEIVSQQFEYAERILAAGLMPIVEPEVSISNPDKQECEDRLHRELIDHLARLKDDQMVALKLTLPERDNLYSDLVAHERITRVTALSGGYGQDEACSRLLANRGMIASFSRAFTEGLRRDLTDSEFDRVLGRTVERIYTASMS